MDWGFAETLAYGTLIDEGLRRAPRRPGRPTRHLLPPSRRCCTTRSTTASTFRSLRSRRSRPISRHLLAAVGGSGAGLRVRLLDDDPNTLVIWEAQFGDFANGAQVVIDQFISLRRSQVGTPLRPGRCCCRTATRARAPSTRRRDSSASCSCAPSTTCRSACRRRRRRCSTCCGGR